MAGPVLATSNGQSSAASNTNTLTSTSIPYVAGDVGVVKLMTWGGGPTMGAPTGGSQTWNPTLIANPGGFNVWLAIYTTTITGSPGSFTISSTPSATCWHSMFVERWTSARLAATPVTATAHGSGAPSTTLTTTAANSAVSWVDGDDNSVNPSTRAYLSAATEEFLDDGHVGSNSVAYYAWQAAAAAGSQTLGLSAPSGQAWTIAAVEIQAATVIAANPLPVRVYPQAVSRAAIF